MLDTATFDNAIIDVDSHFTEPPDLWTSRAPAKLKDRLPQVVERDGKKQWVMDGQFFAPMRAHCAIYQDGSKAPGIIPTQLEYDQAYAASHDIGERVKMMDANGIWAQILYPNKIGFGGAFISKYEPELKLATLQIYNDAMAEIQVESGNRLFGMGLLPWWDVEETIREANRVAKMGLRGVNTNPEPHLQGLPDPGDAHWARMWSTLEEMGMPINFHIGSGGNADWFSDTPWPSLHDEQKLAIGSSVVGMSNMKPISNFILSGMFERYPGLKVVSVESGAGWLPYFLEALDYSVMENMDQTRGVLTMKPSEYFRRNMYACFWFEGRHLKATVEQLGEDNILFETDFPHPTCFYPNAYQRVQSAIEGLEPRVQRKLVSGNASRLYNIPMPPAG